MSQDNIWNWILSVPADIFFISYSFWYWNTKKNFWMLSPYFYIGAVSHLMYANPTQLINFPFLFLLYEIPIPKNVKANFEYFSLFSPQRQFQYLIITFSRCQISDPQAIMCPYDLLGVCKDKECGYLHCWSLFNLLIILSMMK